MKKVDETVITEMLNKNILEPGKYLFTEKFLTITADLRDKVGTYLRKHDYSSTGTGLYCKGEAQQWTYCINRG